MKTAPVPVHYRPDSPLAVDVQRHGQRLRCAERRELHRRAVVARRQLDLDRLGHRLSRRLARRSFVRHEARDEGRR